MARTYLTKLSQDYAQLLASGYNYNNNDTQMEEIEILDKIIQWEKVRILNLPSKLEEWTNENFNSLKTTLQNFLPHIKYFQLSTEEISKIKPYQNILETYIWNDIVMKCLDPEITIISSFSSIITLERVAEISS
ncbi:hypothetical protein C2G38_2179631 [Gigaspora rosea]|uniref:Uncharacterized protein n=1 Tax=Gigaspora rosea TaxID=44941 RepID=A0A397VES5_9GLOM|nr:hypothetical protein C2G38_2179631 [Gigaspora rosea]